jgi:xanthine dehydrogenase YagR molybdenum-binding subunit
VPTAAAVANAVAHALGIRVYELPLSPDRILDALAAKKEA